MSNLNNSDVKFSKDTNKRYPVQVFDNSEDKKTTNILISQEEDILLVPRSFEENKEVYKRFDEDFGLYLTKMSNSPAKKYVEEVFNRQMVYLGYNHKKSLIVSKVFVDTDSLNGVVIEANKLNVNLRTGETSDIDDCIYSVYFGIVRASVILSQNEIGSDKELHKLLSGYLYQLYLKVIGAKTFYSDKSKYLLRLVCIYAFYRNFFEKTHQKTMSIIKRDYQETFQSDDLFKELYPQLENLSKMSTIKEIPKMLVATNLYHSNPNQINLELLKNIGSFIYYSICGTLDYFIASVILSKYPSELYSSSNVGNTKICDTVEKIIDNYIKNIKLKKVEFK